MRKTLISHTLLRTCAKNDASVDRFILEARSREDRTQKKTHSDIMLFKKKTSCVTFLGSWSMDIDGTGSKLLVIHQTLARSSGIKKFDV